MQEEIKEIFGTPTPSVKARREYDEECWKNWKTEVTINKEHFCLPLEIRVEFGFLNFTSTRNKKFKVASPEIKLMLLLKYMEYIDNV